jgi:phosphate-selective porin OprO/OprP
LLAQIAAAGVEELTVGGRLMWDQVVWAGVDEEQEGAFGFDPDNGTEIRRARLFASGKIYSHMKFKVNLDFASSKEVIKSVDVVEDTSGMVVETKTKTETVSKIAVKDAYLELVKVPGIGNARVGHFKEPFFLNELTSSKYITFLERATPVAFAPGRNSGVMFHSQVAEGRLNWQAGAFLTTDDHGAKTGDDGYSVGARVAGLVMGEDQSDRVVHLGASVNYRVPEGESVRFRSRPEIHLSDRLVDTGSVDAESVLLVGAELGGVFGPAHIAGEYVMAGVTSPDADARSEDGDPSFSGFYVQAGYFLTGEHRAYKKGAWSRNKPSASFLDEAGLGAWEIAARYSSLDLNDEDAGIEGGKMDNITLGLNWYHHANARMMFNYVMSSVKDADDEEVGTANAFAVRYQVDF